MSEKSTNSQEWCESFKAEALTSWAEYQETGLHLTWEEVRAWMESCGTEHETVIPKPHI